MNSKNSNSYETDISSNFIQQKSASDIIDPHFEYLIHKNPPLNQELAISILQHKILNAIEESNIPKPQVLLYGINNITDKLISFLNNISIDIIAICDTYKHNQYNTYQNIPVVNPQELTDLNFSIAIVTSFIESWRIEMIKTIQLVHKVKIVSFDSLARNIYTKESKEITLERINSIIDLSKSSQAPTIFFIADKIFFSQLRLSRALQKIGWRTVSINFKGTKDSYHKEFFNHSFQVDLGVFLDKLPLINNVILHTQGWMLSYNLPLLIERYKPSNLPHIIELMDITSFVIPEDSLETIGKYANHAWGESTISFEDIYKLDIECEEHITKFSNGVIYTGSPKQQLLFENRETTKTHLINFNSYPLKEFFSPLDRRTYNNSKEVRLAFIGGITPFGRNYPPQIFGDAQLLGIFRRLSKQGLDVSVFNNPILGTGKRLHERYPEYKALSDEFINFHFLEGRWPWELMEATKHCHYGLMIYEYDNVLIGELHFQTAIPSKLYSYMEMGLPIIVSERAKGVCDIVKKYEIGICINDNEIDDLYKIIEETDYNRLRSNIFKVRDELSIDKQIDRLSNFYNRVKLDVELKYDRYC